MKNLYILLFALFAMNSSMAQWFPQNSGTTKRLNDVYFTNVDTGYAVGHNETGDSGIILKTTNGGIDWIPLLIVDTLEFNSVFFTDANTGYVAGGKQYWSNPAIILKTTNGGTSWSIVFNYSNTNGSASLFSVYFPDPNTGYAVGNIMYTSMGTSPFILKTTNGGTNWTVDESVAGERLSSLFFTSIDTGYAVGVDIYTDWLILKTTNGGVDWTATNSGVQWNYGSLFSVFFTDVNTGYAVGDGVTDGALILKTTNGGTDWVKQPSVTNQYLKSVFFVNVDTGYVICNDAVFKTKNGGTDWFEQSSGTNHWLNSIYILNADTGFIVGWDGTILKTTNGGGDAVGMNEKQKTESLNIFPNPSINTITITYQNGSSLSLEITIYNQTGQKVYRRIPENNTLDISKLQPGMYVVEVATKDGNVRKKLVVQ